MNLVRPFVAAACGTPVISDSRNGIGSIFETGTKIPGASSAGDTVKYLAKTPEV